MLRLGRVVLQDEQILHSELRIHILLERYPLFFAVRQDS